MAEVKLNPTYKVVLTEHERGWGQKLWDEKYFDNEQEAREWAKNYNRTHNTESAAPDWYVVAEYVGRV